MHQFSGPRCKMAVNKPGKARRTLTQIPIPLPPDLSQNSSSRYFIKYKYNTYNIGHWDVSKLILWRVRLLWFWISNQLTDQCVKYIQWQCNSCYTHYMHNIILPFFDFSSLCAKKVGGRPVYWPSNIIRPMPLSRNESEWKQGVLLLLDESHVGLCMLALAPISKTHWAACLLN